MSLLQLLEFVAPLDAAKSVLSLKLESAPSLMLGSVPPLAVKVTPAGHTRVIELAVVTVRKTPPLKSAKALMLPSTQKWLAFPPTFIDRGT